MNVTAPRGGRAEWPALLAPESDRLVLRDGSVAVLRPAVADDRERFQRFVQRLSPDSRRYAPVADAATPHDVVSRFCDSRTPGERFSLLALRQHGEALAVIAAACYDVTAHDTATVWLAVDAAHQGRGLGTALLERLAMVASSRGIASFVSTERHTDTERLALFRDSGFEMHTEASAGAVRVQLDLQPSATAIAAIDERNRIATVASLQPLLQPRAIVVVGVSRRRENLGRRVFQQLLHGGFTGALYPVNPACAEIEGHRCYQSIAEVPAGADLAVIATPRDAVLDAVNACAAAGIRALVVISAGFAEVGAEGRQRQQVITERVRAYGMRMVGPNCMGVLNAAAGIRMNASFTSALPPPGRLALASQSGGVGLALLELARTRQVGLSTFVSLGNKADVSGNDLLQWAESDPQTTAVLLYLESFGNPRRFAQLARRVGRRKPIIAVKAGRTTAGSRAAGSHTAGMASSEAAVSALFAQTGVIRADTIDEMFDVATLLDLQPLPGGARVAILTNTGGPGILAADACEAAGVQVCPLSAATRATLATQLSAHASTANPVDMVASAGPLEYERAVQTLLASADIDSLLVMYTPIDPANNAAALDAIGRGVANARATGIVNKPVLVCALTTATPAAPLPAGNERLPRYVFPENAARALGRATAYALWRRTPAGTLTACTDLQVARARTQCARIIDSRGDTWLTEVERDELFRAFGIPVVASARSRTADAAAADATRLGYPVALKLDAPQVLHKTEVGGVRLNIVDETALREAFDDFARRFPDLGAADGGAAILVQPMVMGVETLVGVVHDRIFGPLVAFGLGGIDTELLRDVAFRIAPLTDLDIDALLHSVRSFPLLDGYRGRPRADLPALRNLLLRVSLLAQQVPELQELDLNPVIVRSAGRGCTVVDARVRLAPTAATTS